MKKQLLVIMSCLCFTITFGQNIPLENLKFWLDAGKGITKDADNKVSNWVDNSSSGVIASQVTATKQPLYVEKAVNGYPAIQFDGENDNLTFSNFPDVNGLASAIIFVVAYDTTSRQNNIWGQYGPFNLSGHDWGGLYFGVSTKYVNWRFGTGEAWDVGDKSIDSVSNFRVGAAVMNGPNDTIFVDGNPVAGQHLTLDTLKNCYKNGAIGAGGDGLDTYFKGQIAEIIFYSKALNDVDRKSVENYLLTKYAKRTQPVFWLKADAGVTADSETGAVSEWKDQSMGNVITTQSTASKQPLLVNSAKTGLPAIQFDGNNDILTFSNFPDVNGLTSATIFTVAYDTTSRQNNIWGQSGPFNLSGHDWGGLYFGVSTKYANWRFGTGEAWDVGDKTIDSVASFRVGAAVMNGSNDTIFVDGKPVAGQHLTLDTLKNCYKTGAIGAGGDGLDSYFKGQIAEIRVYNSALSMAEIQAITSELMAKYATKTQPIFWLKADEGVTADASGSVSAWKDLSASNVTVKQTSPANQPKLVKSSKTGLPAIQFDGKNDKLTFNDFPVVNGLTKATIFTVAYDTTSRQNNIWGQNGPFNVSGSDWGGLYFGVSTKYTNWRFGTGEAWDVGDKTIDSISGFRVGAAVMIGKNDTIFVDGLGVAGAHYTNDTLKNCTRNGAIGAGGDGLDTYFKGQIAEIRFYDTNLEESERKAITAELMAKYNNGMFVPVVSIASTDNMAKEGLDSANIIITRSISDDSLKVNLVNTGTTNAADWTGAIPTEIEFGVGESVKSISLKPAVDALVEGNETLICTLATNAAYTVDNGKNAVTITIVDSISTGINTTNVSSTLSVYPNPSNGVFNLKFNDGTTNANISITDITGREIYSGSLKTSGTWESPAITTKGIYFLKVSKNDNYKVIKKVIVE